MTTKKASPLIATPVPRIIKYKDGTLADLNPDAPVDEIRRLHASTDASLTTAEVHGPELVDGVNVYTIKARVATKG